VTCEHCKTNAGRISKKECCVLRGLAQMPLERLREFSKTLIANEWEALKPKVANEKKRLREMNHERKR
jgi:hypothetical protein